MKGGPARVLDALRRAQGRSCSGETLSADQGVSRAQVWKHIEALRQRGYAIDASPGDGYRLASAPNKLYPEEIQNGLSTRWLGREIHHFEEVDSTNRVAFELARDGAAHGTAVVAEAQTAGRGRLGRSFFSPPARNLYVSIVLRPEVTTAVAPTFILAAATGVADSVARELADTGDAVEIKWPNDVLIRGRKTSGILMELSAEATRVSHMILGIGVNLNVSREEFPEEIRDLATSVGDAANRTIDRAAFARQLFVDLERTFDDCASKGFGPVRTAFEARFRMAGRPVRVLEFGGAETSGTAVGIDADGALLIERADGPTVRVIAGDVTVAKEPV